MTDIASTAAAPTDVASGLRRPQRVRAAAPPSRLRLGIRAFIRDRAALASLAVLVLLGVAVCFANVLAPHDPLVGDASQRLQPPLSPGHVLGVDAQGRDILSRLLHGGRYSLGVAIAPVLLAFPVALAIGLFAGAGRSRMGSVLMRALDAVFAFPIVLLALAIAAVIGGGLGNVMLAIFITLIPYMARVAYTAAVQESGKEYIEAARCQGASKGQILFRELLPNVASPLVVYATANCGLMIVVASGLSFLGVGIQPPTPDWGVMTADGNQVLLEGYAHVATIPGLAILLAAVAFNLLGDGLRDALDPRKQTS